MLLFGLLCFDTISNIFYHYYSLKIFYLFYYTKKENLYLVLNICLYYSLYFGKRIYGVYNYIKEANVKILPLIETQALIIANNKSRGVLLRGFDKNEIANNNFFSM